MSYAVGFTASRTSRPDEQVTAMNEVFKLLWSSGYTTFHHGDCVGGDVQGWLYATQYFRIVSHPPEIPTLRAFLAAVEVREPKPYLERNRDIVDETHVLVALPDGPERVRSGTWSTVRYAHKVARSVYVIWPDGRTELM